MTRIDTQTCHLIPSRIGELSARGISLGVACESHRTAQEGADNLMQHVERELGSLQVLPYLLVSCLLLPVCLLVCSASLSFLTSLGNSTSRPLHLRCD
jgi:hypothetical protein